MIQTRTPDDNSASSLSLQYNKSTCQVQIALKSQYDIKQSILHLTFFDRRAIHEPHTYA